MPPKTSKVLGNSSKGKNKKIGVDGKFDTGTIKPQDRFLFHLREDDIDVVFNFIAFILEMRFCAAVGGKKLRGEKYNPKMCLGNVKSYENPFMIAILCFEELFEVEVLIFKPRVYAVAVGVNGVWSHVSDFTTITGFTGLMNSNALRYNSRYASFEGPPKRFSFFAFSNSIRGIYGSRDVNGFRSLCVILCETMRSDIILRKISHSLGLDGDVRRVVELDENDIEIIQNWRDISGLWMLYDLGFVWDPLDAYQSVGVKDARECAAAQGLLMDMEEGFEDYFDKLRQLSKKVLRTKQRRFIEMNGFIGEDEWNGS